LLLVGFPLLALLLVPVLALLLQTDPALMIDHLGAPEVVQAVTLSLWTSTVSIVVVIILGTPLAYLLARWRFWGHRLLEVLVDLPTVLPPAVTGVALLLAFGRRGLLGNWIEFWGLQIAFTPLAVVLAQIFVAASFYIKTASIGLAAINPEVEQAAALDGAHPIQIFRHVTLPLAWRGMCGGAALGWARALGEFGATIIFAGNFPGRTQTMPLLVYLSFEIHLQLAVILAVILLVISFCVLMVVRTLMSDVDLQ
jgi:molybdate transport system permease protein